MSSVEGMTEHGIMTSKADYWVHINVHPKVRRASWYRVEHCRSFILRRNPPITPGKSKDGTVSGAGYLIRHDEYFIRNVEPWEKYFAHEEWEKLTDRERGLAGEHLVFVLIEHGEIKFPIMSASPLRDRESQLRAVDFKAEYFKRIEIETKTECFDSPNLFVQIKESGHRPNLIIENGTVIKRASQMPGFDEGPPA